MKKPSRTPRPLLAGLLVIAGAVTLAGCGSGVDSGGLTAADRNAAQRAMNALQGSNIPLQLINLTATARQAPAVCRVHLASRKPRTFNVYVFWIPYLGVQSYTWLNMTITADPSRDRFHLGTAATALPGGVLTRDGKTVAAGTADFDTPLALYGPDQVRKNNQVLVAHGGNVFSSPGAKCQVLANGYLRLLPNP